MQAWEKEKAAAMPVRRQTQKIEEDLMKFQTYASELDRKAKEILSATNVKVKDEVLAKTSQSLVDLLELLHKARSKAIGRTSDVDKTEVVK